MIKIKLFNSSTFYSVNEELIDLQTVNSMQYSLRQLSSVPKANTHVCNIIDDIPPVPVVVTPSCNNNSSIQGIPSLFTVSLSDTVKPQQNPVTLKS